METALRHRNWIVVALMVAAVITATLLLQKPAQNQSGAAPRTSFGATVAPPAYVGGLNATNGWVVVSRSQLIAVYAGSEAENHHNGRLVVVRRTGARRTVHSVAIRGSGAITLLRPAAVGSVSAAGNAQLRFVTAAGATGTIDLTTYRVSVH